MTTLEFSHVTKTLQRARRRPHARARRRQLHPARPAQTLALVGQSGSGKSTIAKILTQLETGDERRQCCSTAQPIPRRGKGLRRYRQQVRMVFQDPFASLNPSHSIRHHLERPLPPRPRRARGPRSRTRCAACSSACSLDPDGDDRPPSARAVRRSAPARRHRPCTRVASVAARRRRARLDARRLDPARRAQPARRPAARVAASACSTSRTTSPPRGTSATRSWCSTTARSSSTARPTTSSSTRSTRTRAPCATRRPTPTSTSRPRAAGGRMSASTVFLAVAPPSTCSPRGPRSRSTSSCRGCSRATRSRVPREEPGQRQPRGGGLAAHPVRPRRRQVDARSSTSTTGGCCSRGDLGGPFSNGPRARHRGASPPPCPGLSASSGIATILSFVLGTSLGAIIGWRRGSKARRHRPASRPSSRRSRTSGWASSRSRCSPPLLGWFPASHAYGKGSSARVHARLLRRR